MCRDGGKFEQIIGGGLIKAYRMVCNLYNYFCELSKAASCPTKESWEARSDWANDDVREDGFVRTIVEDDILEQWNMMNNI